MYKINISVILICVAYMMKWMTVLLSAHTRFCIRIVNLVLSNAAVIIVQRQKKSCSLFTVMICAFIDGSLTISGNSKLCSLLKKKKRSYHCFVCLPLRVLGCLQSEIPNRFFFKAWIGE